MSSTFYLFTYLRTVVSVSDFNLIFSSVRNSCQFPNQRTMKTNLFFVFGLCLLGSLVSVPITTVSDENSVATPNSEMGAVQKDENNNVVGVATNMMGKVVTSSDVESQMVHLKKTTSSSVSSKNEEGVKNTRVARQEPEDEDDDDDEIIDFFGDDDDDSDDDESDESAAAVKEEDEEEDEDDIFSVIGSLLDDDEDDDSDDDDKTSVSVTLSQPSAAASPEVVAETAENEIAGNSVEQQSVIDDVSNIEDSTRIKNTVEGENPVLMTSNQQSVQNNNAQAISGTNNNQGSSNETSDDEDDDEDDDDEDEDDDLVLGDDDDEDDDEEDDDDEGDLEGAILDARHAREFTSTFFVCFL